MTLLWISIGILIGVFAPAGIGWLIMLFEPPDIRRRVTIDQLLAEALDIPPQQRSGKRAIDDNAPK